MSTWLSIVHRISLVRSKTTSASISPSMATMAVTALTYPMDHACIPTMRRTHGGRSTWEYRCTSTASNSPTETARVRTVSSQGYRSKQRSNICYSAPRSTKPPKKRSGHRQLLRHMVHNQAASHIPALNLPSRNRYSFTDHLKMEG